MQIDRTNGRLFYPIFISSVPLTVTEVLFNHYLVNIIVLSLSSNCKELEDNAIRSKSLFVVCISYSTVVDMLG